jgi:oligopeptidase B
MSKPFVHTFIFIFAISIFNACTPMQESQSIQEPKAAKKPHRLEKHGDVRIDNYYWLRERENPEVIDYLNSENAYREQIMKGTEDLQKNLFDEMVGRIKKDDSSVPYKLEGYFYYTRFSGESEYPIYCRKEGSLESEEEIMLDVNELAEGHAYYQVGGLSISPDNNTIAFGVDTKSRRIYTIHFKDLTTGEIFKETIPGTTGGGTWAADNKTLFYTLQNETTLRSERVMKHKFGTESAKDTEVFFESDETFNTYVYKTKSKKFIVIASSATLSEEYRTLPADAPDDEFSIFQPRERNLEYSISHYDGNWYVRTNKDGADNFKLMKCPEGATLKENWVDLLEHRKDVFFEGMELFKNFMVVEERSNGLTQIRVMPWDGSEEHYLDFGEETYTSYIGSNPDFDSKILRYGYSSLTTPSSVIDYHLVEKTKDVKKEQEVVGGYDKTNYESKRVWATADDGAKVAISLVYKKGIEFNGKNPTLLYAYGSYGATIDPYFSSARLSLLERGFVYAIAHIRGGQYLGRQWYENGKFLKKINTFSDYIACSDYLIDQNYTSSQKLFAMGGSAGGLLMGAVVNMKPENFRGVVAAVPFVDVVTTMLDEDIPLTTGEYDEWGNPNDKVYYDYMKSYSPYDNVKPRSFPAMLITTGLHDSQVQYWEPAKWIAKMRDMRTNKDEPLLMYCNMDTGHGGASGRFESYKETAMEYAFLLDLAGMVK